GYPITVRTPLLARRVIQVAPAGARTVASTPDPMPGGRHRGARRAGARRRGGGRRLLGDVERRGGGHTVPVEGDRHRLLQPEVLAVEVGEGHEEAVSQEGQQVVPHRRDRRAAGGQQRLVVLQERGLHVDHVLAVVRRAVGRVVGRGD